MNMTPDFRAAAYRINRILNGMQQEWHDEGTSPPIAAYRQHLYELGEHILPYLRDRDAGLARGLEDVLQYAADDKPSAMTLVYDTLRHICTAIPELAVYLVDFDEYCLNLHENKSRALLGLPWRDPNMRPA